MPFFFFSYARKDWNPDDSCLEKFYNDLLNLVAERKALPKEEAGFRDAVNLQPGDQSLQVMTDALKTCQVFIYVRSPRYFLSDNCGREWQFFWDRIETYCKALPVLTAPPRLLQPVLWTPPRDVNECPDLSGRLPDYAANAQYTHDSYPTEYSTRGLHEVMRRSFGDKKPYEDFLHQFVERLLSETNENCLPPCQDSRLLDDVPSAFAQHHRVQPANPGTVRRASSAESPSANFSRPQAVTPQQEPLPLLAGEEALRLGLTLSGRGFRATLYHLGVIRFLYETKRLARVTHICSVSGGSILAAHLILNWSQYTGTEEKFNRAATELIEFVRQDIRSRVIRRWLFGLLTSLRWWRGTRWTRTSLLECEYAKLYQDKPLRELSSDETLDQARSPEKLSPADAPELYILATSLTTGEVCSFSRDGFCKEDALLEIGSRPPEAEGQVSTDYQEDFISAEHLKIAAAVAASTVFPPLFPPVPMTRQMLRVDQEQLFPVDQYLGDGGIFPNLGIRKLYWLQQKNKVPLDLILVSDAQGLFDWQTHSSGMQTSKCKKFVNCSIQDAITVHEEPHALPGSVQRKSQSVRTDLDAFSAEEMEVLVRQGYTTAQNAWRTQGPETTTPARDTPWSIAALLGMAPINVDSINLTKSKNPKLWVWSPRDGFSWASLGLLCLAAAPVILLLLGFIHVSRESADLRDRLQDQELLHPGSLIWFGQETAAVCCFVDTLDDPPKTCFVTTNRILEASEFNNDNKGRPAYARGVMGRLELVIPVYFPGLNETPGALFVTNPEVISEKNVIDLNTIDPGVGDPVQVIGPDSSFAGHVISKSSSCKVPFRGKIVASESPPKVKVPFGDKIVASESSPKVADFQDLAVVQLEDKQVQVYSGAPVIHRQSRRLLGMAYHQDDSKIYVVPIDLLQSRLRFKKLTSRENLIKQR